MNGYHIKTTVSAFVGSAVLFFSSIAWSAPDIVIKELFRNAAVVQIEANTRLLKAGVTSPEGVTLLSANKQEAVLMFDGQAYILGLNQQDEAVYNESDSSVVRVSQDKGFESPFAGAN